MKLKRRNEVECDDYFTQKLTKQSEGTRTLEC